MVNSIKKKYFSALNIHKERGTTGLIGYAFKKIIPESNPYLSCEFRIIVRCDELKSYRVSPFKVSPVDKNNKEEIIDATGQSAELVSKAFSRGENCFVIKDGNKVVSYVWVGPLSNSLVSDTGFEIIDNSLPGSWCRAMYVDSAYRLRGYPYHLLKFWKDSYKGKNVPSLYGEIHPSNSISRTAHQKLGFREIGSLFCISILGLRIYRYTTLKNEHTHKIWKIKYRLKSAH